jgi:hypothetical protein
VSCLGNLPESYRKEDSEKRIRRPTFLHVNPSNVIYNIAISLSYSSRGVAVSCIFRISLRTCYLSSRLWRTQITTLRETAILHVRLASFRSSMSQKRTTAICDEGIAFVLLYDSIYWLLRRCKYCASSSSLFNIKNPSYQLGEPIYSRPSSSKFSTTTPGA